jgi:hypothetical protein
MRRPADPSSRRMARSAARAIRSRTTGKQNVNAEQTGRWLPLRPRRLVLNLRAAARVREIDRQLQRVRFAQRGLRWVVLPACLAMSALLVRQFAASGYPLTLGLAAGIVLPVVAIVVGLLHASREAAQRCRELERERLQLSEAVTATTASFGATGEEPPRDARRADDR